MSFKVGDVVFVSNPDKEYEAEDGVRYHSNFFGKVTNVREHEDGDMVCVRFDEGVHQVEWSYNANELALASVLKDLSFEDFMYVKKLS